MLEMSQGEAISPHMTAIFTFPHLSTRICQRSVKNATFETQTTDHIRRTTSQRRDLRKSMKSQTERGSNRRVISAPIAIWQRPAASSIARQMNTLRQRF